MTVLVWGANAPLHHLWLRYWAEQGRIRDQNLYNTYPRLQHFLSQWFSRHSCHLNVSIIAGYLKKHSIH